MKTIEVEKFSKLMRDYFIKLIEKHEHEVDVVNCNADLHQILDENSTINGWNLRDDKTPPTDRYILLSFENFSVPLVGRYEEDTDGDGAFYIGDEDESCISQDIIVNAWMDLPQCHREDGCHVV